ncbi:hypothetical protein, partial [Enterococcus faecium]|uniref:hypothetical protein n=1 Tax=Enterococcus faecium TaxID=1352 RepID=UPI001CA31AD2
TNILSQSHFPNKRCFIYFFRKKFEKQFSEIPSYFLKLTTSVTTSSLNGVQKLASAVISPTKRKI